MSKYGGPPSPGSFRVGNSVFEAQPKANSSRNLRLEDPVQPKLRIISDPDQFPIGTRLSDNVPRRDFSQPPNNYRQFATNKVNSKSESKTNSDGMPRYIGTSYTHMVNAPSRQMIAPPTDVTIPRPYPALSPTSRSSSTPLNNRTATGRILGTAAKNFISAEHIPYMPPDEPVGPDNPVKVMNDIWSACWDGEAGAIYYYNRVSGEATWIPPEI